MKKYKAQEGGCSGSSSGKKRFQKSWWGKGTGGGGCGEGRDPNKTPSTPYFKCHKTGHWPLYCPNSKPKKEQAHLAHDEEDEPTLLMATPLLSLSTLPQPRLQVPATPQSRRLAAALTSKSPASSPSSTPGPQRGSGTPPVGPGHRGHQSHHRRQGRLFSSSTKMYAGPYVSAMGLWQTSRAVAPSSSCARTANIHRMPMGVYYLEDHVWFEYRWMVVFWCDG
jgi:hypothetical protein